MTKRQQIINAIKAALSTIPEFGANVFEWRVTPFDPGTNPDELPGTDVRDPQEIRAIAIGTWERTLAVDITVIQSGAACPSDMRELIGKIESKIGEDPSFGGLAQDTTLVNDEASFEQREHLVGALTLHAKVAYTTDPFNPYQ